jgi:predicted nucleic acid-binding protein
VTLVVDASVILKWLLRDLKAQAETERATQLMEHILSGYEPMLQPIHWLAEVAAVLTRLSPQSVETDVALLQALEIPASDSPDVLRRGCRLAVDLDQHLFDTLYHAVALETQDATLITADQRYFAKARSFGCVMRLADWAPRQTAS